MIPIWSILRALLLILTILSCIFTTVYGTISSVSVSPVSLIAGVMSDVTVSFSTDATITTGSTIVVTLPSDFTIATSTTSLSVDSTVYSTTLSISSVTSTEIQCLIGSADIVASTSFEFKISDVTNPGATTTGTFTVEATNTNTVSTASVDIVSSTFTVATVVPDVLTAGVTGTTTVSFTSLVTLPIGSFIDITFPSGFQVTTTAETTGLTSVTNLDSSSIVTKVSSLVARVTVQGTDVATGATVSFKVAGITNPAETGTVTGDFSIESKDSNTLIFQTSTTIAGVTIVSTDFSAASISPDSLNAGVTGTVSVSFTSLVNLPIGSFIDISFPSAFTITSAAETTALASVNNLDTSSTVTKLTSSIIRVTIVGTDITAGSNVSFQVAGITNPGEMVLSTTFSLATRNSNAELFQINAAIPGVEISSTILDVVSFGLDTYLAGVASMIQVKISTSVTIPIGGFIGVTLPLDFVLPSSITLVDTDSSVTRTGTIVGQVVTFLVSTASDPATYNLQVETLVNPGTKYFHVSYPLDSCAMMQ